MATLSKNAKGIPQVQFSHQEDTGNSDFSFVDGPGDRSGFDYVDLEASRGRPSAGATVLIKASTDGPVSLELAVNPLIFNGRKIFDMLYSYKPWKEVLNTGFTRSRTIKLFVPVGESLSYNISGPVYGLNVDYVAADTGTHNLEVLTISAL